VACARHAPHRAFPTSPNVWQSCGRGLKCRRSVNDPSQKGCSAAQLQACVQHATTLGTSHAARPRTNTCERSTPELRKQVGDVCKNVQAGGLGLQPPKQAGPLIALQLLRSTRGWVPRRAGPGWLAGGDRKDNRANAHLHTHTTFTQMPHSGAKGQRHAQRGGQPPRSVAPGVMDPHKHHEWRYLPPGFDVGGPFDVGSHTLLGGASGSAYCHGRHDRGVRWCLC
jgi:hypothetical protein